jgi:hypothetical protein
MSDVAKRRDAYAPGTGDPDSSTVALVLSVGGVLLIVVIFLLQAFYYAYEGRQLSDRVYDVEYTSLRQSRAQHETQLQGYRWVNERAGEVAIPIERAIKLYVTEQQQKQR